MLCQGQKTLFDRAQALQRLDLRITPGRVKEVVLADLVGTLAVAHAQDSGGRIGDRSGPKGCTGMARAPASAPAVGRRCDIAGKRSGIDRPNILLLEHKPA